MSVGFCHFLKLCHLLQECRWCRRLGEAEGRSPPSPRLQEESSSHNQNLRQRRLLRKNSTPHRSPWGPDQAAANAGPTGGHARRVTNPLSSVGSGEAASEKITCCSAENSICLRCWRSERLNLGILENFSQPLLIILIISQLMSKTFH